VQELLAPSAGLAFNEYFGRGAQESQLIVALEEPPENAGPTVFETALNDAVQWHGLSQ